MALLEGFCFSHTFTRLFKTQGGEVNAYAVSVVEAAGFDFAHQVFYEVTGALIV